MPTWIPNVDCEVWFDNSVPTLTDMSDYISKVTLLFTNSVVKFGTFGLAAKQAVEGDADWNGDIGVRPSTDTGGAHQEILDRITPASGKPGAFSGRLFEPDSAALSFQWDFEMYVKSYSAVDQDADGDGTPTIRPMPYEVDGAPTLTVVT